MSANFSLQNFQTVSEGRLEGIVVRSMQFLEIPELDQNAESFSFVGVLPEQKH